MNVQDLLCLKEVINKKITILTKWNFDINIYEKIE
jgi:hypothetical protein